MGFFGDLIGGIKRTGERIGDVVAGGSLDAPRRIQEPGRKSGEKSVKERSEEVRVLEPGEERISTTGGGIIVRRGGGGGGSGGGGGGGGVTRRPKPSPGTSAEDAVKETDSRKLSAGAEKAFAKTAGGEGLTRADYFALMQEAQRRGYETQGEITREDVQQFVKAETRKRQEEEEKEENEEREKREQKFQEKQVKKEGVGGIIIGSTLLTSVEDIVPRRETIQRGETKPERMIATTTETVVKKAPSKSEMFLRRISGGIDTLSEGVEEVVSVGGLLGYEKSKKEPYELQVVEETITGAGATGRLRKPTKEEMPPEMRFKAEQFEQQISLGVQSEIIASELKEKYQEKVNRGELTLIQARKKLSKEYERKLKPHKERYKESLKKAEKEYKSGIMISTLPLTAGKGFVFGGISVIAPPVGLTFAGITGAKAVKEFPTIESTFREFPLESSLQVGAGLVGAAVGAYTTSKSYTGLRNLGLSVTRKSIKAERVISKQVLKGRKTFPTAPPKTHLSLFKASKIKKLGETRPGMFHATAERFGRQIKISTAKTSEVAGLYGAPKISPYFLRTQQGYRLFGLGTESILSKSPRVLRITPKGFVKGFPKKTGYAYVPGIKSEIEAVLTPGTLLQRTAKKYMTEYKGVKIPINQYRVISSIEKASIPDTELITLSKLSSSYAKASSISLVTPASITRAVRIKKPKSRVTSYKRKQPSLSSSISKVSRAVISGYAGSGVSKPRVKAREPSISSIIGSSAVSIPGISSLIRPGRLRQPPYEPTTRRRKIQPPLIQPPPLVKKTKAKYKLPEKEFKPSDTFLFAPSFSAEVAGVTRKFKKGELKKLAGSPIELGASLRAVPVGKATKTMKEINKFLKEV